MIISRKLTLSENQAITATAVSTNVLAWPDNATVTGESAPYARDMGSVDRFPIHVQVTEDFNNLTSLTIALETSANENMSSPTVLYTVTVPVAQLKAGYVVPLRYIPPGTMLKHLAMRYTVTGTAPTTGKITSTIGAGDL